MLDDQVLIIDKDRKIYRPAGVRSPIIGETYISNDGKIKICKLTGGEMSWPRRDTLRQIVRELKLDDSR